MRNQDQSEVDIYNDERVITNENGDKELISRSMVRQERIKAAAYELKEIATDENVMLIESIDKYTLKLDRDEARIKDERRKLTKARKDAECRKSEKYGTVRDNFDGKMAEKVAESNMGFDFSSLKKPMLVTAVAGIIVSVILIWSGAIPMVFAGTTDNGVPQELVDTIIEPGMAPMPDGAPNATPPGVHDPKAPSA